MAGPESHPPQTRGRLPTPLWILLGLYLAFGVFALAVVLIDPSDDPLAAVFLVLAALPWTLLVSALNDWTGEWPVWLNLASLSAGVLANAALLYGLGRLVFRRGAGAPRSAAERGRPH